MEAVLLGNFNRLTLNWTVDIFSECISLCDRKTLTSFDSLGLVQWVTEPTITFANKRDLLLTTEPGRVRRVEVLKQFPWESQFLLLLIMFNA